MNHWWKHIKLNSPCHISYTAGLFVQKFIWYVYSTSYIFTIHVFVYILCIWLYFLNRIWRTLCNIICKHHSGVCYMVIHVTCVKEPLGCFIFRRHVYTSLFLSHLLGSVNFYCTSVSQWLHYSTLAKHPYPKLQIYSIWGVKIKT